MFENREYVPDHLEQQIMSESDNRMALTNGFIHNRPYVEQHELNTTKDRRSFFLIYSKLNEYDVGCEYTLKRKGLFPRYECKKCRSLCDRDRRRGCLTEKEAAITLDGNGLKNIIKSTHHPECRLEFFGTAMARSQKNAAVVYKSVYGGTSKQAYDKHTNILQVSGNLLTALDLANGFRPFEYASSALKKSNKRKTATRVQKVIVDEDNAIDKTTTRILKSTHNEPTDFFLIGQKAGVVVLGSLVERLFRAEKCLSDGTFKMTPKGFKQSYMLWYIAEGNCKNEVLDRSKAILATTFILKSKSEATYQIAFEILDKYRRQHNIPEPAFQEYITDDEPAVRNVVGKLYPSTNFSLCFFHHNQNIVKCLAQYKLSSYIRRCQTDEQLWFYGKIKQILVLPLLPPNDVVTGFDILRLSILGFIESNFTNRYEVEQFKKFFDTVKDRYFSNEEKIRLTCKYGKHLRSTNLIESTHFVFNKSSIIPTHGTVSNFIHGMITIDIQYRALAIAFEDKGASVFAKKKTRYAKQQAVITEATEDFDNKKIGVDQFLKKCSEAMIHEKYFKLVEAATERVEESPLDDVEESDTIR